MIGVFDSGSGGLTFLAAMRFLHPEYDYVYFADYEHCPFWEKEPEEIQSLTISGVQKLFDAGATVVILACNTAAAWTLRKMQTEVFPDRNILWVTIPGAEKVVELGLKNITVFATEQTVKSRTYAERVNILDPHVTVTEIPLHNDVVRTIEFLLPIQRCHSWEDFSLLESSFSDFSWSYTGEEWDHIIESYFLPNISSDTDGIVLWCTHYSYLKNTLQKHILHTPIIDPSLESAQKLSSYIVRKNIILTKMWSLSFL